MRITDELNAGERVTPRAEAGPGTSEYIALGLVLGLVAAGAITGSLHYSAVRAEYAAAITHTSNSITRESKHERRQPHQGSARDCPVPAAE
jgi:hypothetical protein